MRLHKVRDGHLLVARLGVDGEGAQVALQVVRRGGHHDLELGHPLVEQLLVLLRRSAALKQRLDHPRRVQRAQDRSIGARPCAHPSRVVSRARWMGTGTGANRAILGALDTAWMIKTLFERGGAPEQDQQLLDEWVAEFKVMVSSSPDDLQSNLGAFTIDPKTRYKKMTVTHFM